MKSNKIKVALALAGIVFAGLLFWRQTSKPTVNLRPSSAVGEVLADELGRLLGGKGQVVVIGRSASRDGVDARGEQIASLQAALKQRASVQLASTEWLPRPPMGTMDLGGISSDQFQDILDKNKDANAFVIFAGLPPLSSELTAKIASRAVKLLAVCGYNGNVRSWIDKAVLAGAVVPRSDDLPPGTPAPKTAKDWFQREFQLLTAENIGQLGY